MPPHDLQDEVDERHCRIDILDALKRVYDLGTSRQSLGLIGLERPGVSLRLVVLADRLSRRNVVLGDLQSQAPPHQ